MISIILYLIIFDTGYHIWYCDRALAQVAQEGCRVSILGDFQKPNGHSPGQPAISDPVWAGGLDQITFRGPFQPQQLCDSVMGM